MYSLSAQTPNQEEELVSLTFKLGVFDSGRRLLNPRFGLLALKL